MLIAALVTGAATAAPVVLAPFSGAPPGAPPAPWRLVTLPKIARHTSFSIVDRDGSRVLQVEANGSYANLLHRVDADLAAAPTLSWRWRVDVLSAQTDITRKEGDDLPARLCVLFDLPLSRLKAMDRMAVIMGRALFDPDLPAATICYVWDAHVSPGTWLVNAYTARVMMAVLRRGPATDWEDERRDLRSDFARAFPAEAASGPAPHIAAIAISADGDNTGARSLAFIGDIVIGE
ncbi:MAG TPA: DUF3047 domain-containing protein [Burkholderiaceae bacterium]|nr:DUF3047 domain-containing protein [Burkholderiaceae bacterium]